MLDTSMSSHPTGSPERAAALTTESVAALREAIRREVTGESQDGELPDALRRLTREARALGLHAEQVVILVKELWREVPEPSPAPTSDEHRRMLERLVTLSIEEFYAGT